MGAIVGGVGVGVTSMSVMVWADMWEGWAWADIDVVVMGVCGVGVHTIGVGTGGVDAMVSKVVTMAPEISRGTLIQVRPRQ